MSRWIFLTGFLFCFITSVAKAAPPQVRITDMNDIPLGTWGVVSDMSGNDPVCVYKNTGNFSYNVKVTDNSTITPGQFRLENAAKTVQLPYTVNWGETASPGTVVLSDNVAYGANGAGRVSETCLSGGLTGNLQVTVAAANLATVPAGTYTATVTVLISP